MISELSISVYIASWAAILYYMLKRGQHILHVLIPVFLILLNAALLLVQLSTSSHVSYVKVGAATEASLLFILFMNLADYLLVERDLEEGPD